MKRSSLQLALSCTRRSLMDEALLGKFATEDEFIQAYRERIDMLMQAFQPLLDHEIEEYKDFDSVPTVRDELEFERDYCEDHLHPVWHFLEGKN